jgi:hypothetical protein
VCSLLQISGSELCSVSSFSFIRAVETADELSCISVAIVPCLANLDACYM